MKKLSEFVEENDFKNILFENNNLDSWDKEKAINALKHLRKQFQKRYKYLVGEWENSPRAKNTRDGKFVENNEVIKFLKSKG